jgi:hypothetical protein
MMYNGYNGEDVQIMKNMPKLLRRCVLAGLNGVAGIKPLVNTIDAANPSNYPLAPK